MVLGKTKTIGKEAVVKIFKKIQDGTNKVKNAFLEVGSWKDKRVVHKYKDGKTGIVTKDDGSGTVTVSWDNGKEEPGVIKDNLKLIP